MATNYKDKVDFAVRIARVNEAPLRDRVQHGFAGVTGAEAELFANRLAMAFQHFAEKARHGSAGKKLSAAICELVQDWAVSRCRRHKQHPSGSGNRSPKEDSQDFRPIRV